MSPSLTGYIRATSCCGLNEVYSLGCREYGTTRIVPSRGTGYLATTIDGMGYQVNKLKRLGFRAVGTWRNARTGSHITAWLWDGRKKRKRKTTKAKKARTK